MANVPNNPSPQTLLNQLARWCALGGGGGTGSTLNAAAPVGWPMGVRLLDPELVAAAPAEHVFTSTVGLYARALPEAGRAVGHGKFAVSFTLNPSPVIDSGIDRPATLFAVRITCEAAGEDGRSVAVEVLAAIAAALKLPGYSIDGRALTYHGGALQALSDDARTSVEGTVHGMLGMPPPEAINLRANGLPLWRVISIDQLAPIQVISDEIDAALAGAQPAASGGRRAAMMIVLVTAVPGRVLPCSLALTVSRGGLATGDDAAVRVEPASGDSGRVVVRTGRFTAAGGAQVYQGFDGSAGGGVYTIGGLKAQLQADGWTVTGAAFDARPMADLIAIDWRRAVAGDAATLRVLGVPPGGGGS
ncbi:MAG: hypothetical protein ACKVZJ_10145 [Phycisphaerales bacterium]